MIIFFANNKNRNSAPRESSPTVFFLSLKTRQTITSYTPVFNNFVKTDCFLEQSKLNSKKVVFYNANFALLPCCCFHLCFLLICAFHPPIPFFSLQHGACVNAMDLWQFTPLHEAASKNRVEVCSLLLSHGADPTLLNCHSKSSVDMAPTPELKERLTCECVCVCVGCLIYINCSCSAHC